MPPFARDRDSSRITRVFVSEQGKTGCPRTGHAHEVCVRLSRKPCEHRTDLRNECLRGFLEIVAALAPFAKCAAILSIPAKGSGIGRNSPEKGSCRSGQQKNCR